MKRKLSKHRIISMPATSLSKPFIYKGHHGWFFREANNHLVKNRDLMNAKAYVFTEELNNRY